MGIFVLLVVAALLVLAVVSQRQEADRKRAIQREAEEWLEDIERDGTLEPIPVSVSLKRGEEGYHEVLATLHEPRAVRHHVGASSSVRIMKGLSIRTSRGRSVSTQEWRQIDSGTLVVTNRRVVFDGSGEHRSIEISKIDGIHAFADGVRLTLSNRKKPFSLVVSQPLILATMLAALRDPKQYLPKGPK